VTFADDFGFERRHLPIVERLLAHHGRAIVRVIPAAEDEDRRLAFDVQTVSRRVAVRVRRREYWDSHGDITIRSNRSTGSETELSKLRRGLGDLYLYGWSNESANGPRLPDDQLRLVAWVLFDVEASRDVFRAQQQGQSNNDGTYFNSYPIEKLRCVATSDSVRERLAA